VLSHWCIWHVGTMQDSEDTIHPPCDECGSQSNHPMPSSLPPGHWQTFATLWTYCPQLITRGPPPCCRCGDPGAACRLEATVRKTQPHLASCSGGRPWPTEHWPCSCLEEGSYSWRLAAHCGHSNAPAEYAIKEEESKGTSTRCALTDLN